MTTSFETRAKRRTVNAFRVGIQAAIAFPAGTPGARRLIVTLERVGACDMLRIREERRRYTVDLDVGELYRRGMIAQAAKTRAEKRKARKGRA